MTAPQIGTVLFLMSASATGATPPFALPSGIEEAGWEAEAAGVGAGWQRTRHPWASGGEYVAADSPSSMAVLEFPFRLERSTRLRVRPVWWRHGERLPAKRFPHPFKVQQAQAPVDAPMVGPEVLATCGRFVFFTAPATGRIGVLDAGTEQVVATVDIGGYPADMIADDGAGRIYVADASQDRVAVIDAHRREVVASVKTPAFPASLALHEGYLLVACMSGKSLVKIDPDEGRIVETLDLGLRPRHVEVAKGRAIVRLLPLVIDPTTFREEAPDRLFYHVQSKREAGYPDPMPVVVRGGRYFWPDKVVLSPKQHLLRVREKPWGRTLKEVDVGQVTKSAAQPGSITWPLIPNPGPDALDELAKALFFTAPSAGRVGVFDMEADALLGGIDVGGYLSDLVVHVQRKKVYVADGAGNRVVVIDAESRKIRKAIDVPRLPVALALDGDRLFVACHRGRCLAVVDTARDEVTQTVPLPARDAALGVDLVRLYPPYTCLHLYGLFYPPESEMPKKILVTLAPLSFDATTLKEVPLTRRVGNPTKRERVKVKWRLSDETGPPSTDVSDPALVASWGFWPDEAAARGCRDLSGHQRQPEEVKAVLVKTERFGQALRFNGRDTQVNVGDAQDLVPTDKLTVEAWVKWEGPGRSGENIKDDPSSCIVGCRGPSSGFMLCVASGGQAMLNINGLNQQKDRDMDIVRSAARAERGEWVHVVGVYDASGPTISAYLNGRGVHKRAKGTMQPSPKGLAIGIQCAKNPWYLFKGDIAQVRMYSRALSQSEIHERHERVATERSKAFVGTNTHTLRVDGGRHIDVSSVTDPQILPEPARLRPGDTPGTITLAIDDGPEHDWSRNIWITPTDGRYLASGSDEFWRWNAPTFTLAPGQHVLRVRAAGPHARLDALRVARSLTGKVSIDVQPEPRQTHQPAPIPHYHGVFYYDEPVRLTLTLASPDSVPQRLRVRYDVRNFVQEGVAGDEWTVNLDAGKSWQRTLEIRLKEHGIFRMQVHVKSRDGASVKDWWFLRLPKLEHPRLLVRRDEMDAVRERIKRHPRLFARYRQWLQEQCAKPDFLRESLLDRYPSKSYKDEASKWRVVACQLAAMFLGDHTADFFASKADPLIKGRYRDSGGVGQYVHNCFPSVPVCLADLAAHSSSERQAQIQREHAGSLGAMRVLAEHLLALAEPLSIKERAVLDREMMWLLNVDRYFDIHAGTRGGNWWLSERTGCCCPLHGVARAFLFHRNVFGMKRFFERPAMGGLFTHHEYVHPRFDKSGYFPHFLSRGEGRGSAVMRDIVPCLAKQPVELADRAWKGWVEQLEQPSLSQKDADQLFAAPLGDVLPWFLALGWFDPSAPQVRWDEMPPTVLFDGEDEVVMHSDMTADQTRIYFTCGVRDMIYRGQPSHFEVMKAGRILIGTGSLQSDHGQPTPSWGNVVAVGDECLDWWRSNVGHRRGMDQHLVINRHSYATETYVPRDQQLCGYQEPGRSGSGYTLGFHTHTKHPFVREGQIVAYETRPEYDYVAGDATNTWRPSDVSYAYRQLVFVPANARGRTGKPGADVIVIYDRVGVQDRNVRWLAATGSHLLVEGSTFLVENRPVALRGRVLLPSSAQLKSTPPYPGFAWRFQQRVLEVRPERTGDEVEFLIVMCIGKGGPVSLDGVTRITEDGHVGAEIPVDSRRVRVLFRRGDPVGGRLEIHGAGGAAVHQLVERVDDGYRHWRSHPHWKAWTTEPRFRFIMGKPR